jgi:NDP-sugar pyrophosphorylase family protein
MLKVGQKPILETNIQNFIDFGYKNFQIAVNYYSEQIEEYFKDGAELGAHIEYVHENKRMGTAGAIGLLKNKPDKPFFVMNADLLTKVNFNQLMDFHKEHNAMATMCVRQYDQQVPYGIVKIKNNQLLGIEEKPVNQYFINGGIYVLNPETINYIPKDNFFDMTSLFDILIKNGKICSAFPIREYWLDIGQKQDFDRANDEFNSIFG